MLLLSVQIKAWKQDYIRFSHLFSIICMSIFLGQKGSESDYTGITEQYTGVCLFVCLFVFIETKISQENYILHNYEQNNKETFP